MVKVKVPAPVLIKAPPPASTPATLLLPVALTVNALPPLFKVEVFTTANVVATVRGVPRVTNPLEVLLMVKLPIVWLPLSNFNVPVASPVPLMMRLAALLLLMKPLPKIVQV